MILSVQNESVTSSVPLLLPVGTLPWRRERDDTHEVDREHVLRTKQACIERPLALTSAVALPDELATISAYLSGLDFHVCASGNEVFFICHQASTLLVPASITSCLCILQPSEMGEVLRPFQVGGLGSIPALIHTYPVRQGGAIQVRV